MKRALLLVFLLPVLASLSSPATAKEGDLRAAIDEYMNAVAEVQHFMGAVLVARGDDIIIAKGYGMADVEAQIPNTAHTRFRIGSVTKQFTAMAILMLEAKGKLDLQDSVCDYLSECPSHWQNVTIYNLLTHTSGIPSFTTFPKYLTVRTQQMSPQELVALFRDKPLTFKPGTEFQYSNSGYVLLGYIIERVSGKSYAQFLEKHIFEPLGMTHSGYAADHPDAKHHAEGYRYASGEYKPVPFVDMSVPYSAGALYSTVHDLYTWDRALAAGKLLPAPLREKMLSPQVPVKGKVSKIVGTGGPDHYGFGWFVTEAFGRTVYSHEGAIAGFTAINSWFPGENIYIIVLDNMSSPDIFKIARDLAAIVFGEDYEIPQPLEAISLPADALKKFVGTYQMTPERFITVSLTDGQLKARLTGQPALPIYPESPTHFFYKAVRAEIFFKTNEKGKVTGLVLHQRGMKMPARRVDPAKARKATDKPEAISLPPEALEKFVGTYQLFPGFAITITVEGDHLMAQGTGQPAAPIFPSSKTEFFSRVVNARFTFQVNDKGEVTGLTLHQHGRDIRARKVD